MVNILTGEIKYFNKSNSCFCKKMNNGGGIINGDHLLPDRVDEKVSDSNDKNPSLFSDETDKVFNSIENP